MKKALRLAIPVVVIGALLLSAVPASAKAKPPAKRYYLALFMGMDGPYSVGAGCMRFTASKVTILGQGVSGPWARAGSEGNQTLFGTNMSTTMEILGQVVPVTIDGTAVSDDTGERSSIGGAANLLVELAGVTQNIGLVGREVGSKSKCKKMAKQFNNVLEEASLALERD